MIKTNKQGVLRTGDTGGVWSAQDGSGRLAHRSRTHAVPTKQQLALAEFADSCEVAGFRPGHYYRLTHQIMEARAAIAQARANGWEG